MAKTVQDWLTDFESRYTQEINLGLERVQELAQTLGLNSFTVPVITVAGTNGKGTTVGVLESIYTKAGFRVGAYTSPHLLSFNERIKINQKPVSDEQLANAFLYIDTVRKAIPLTYFEIATLAALWIFKQNPLDLIILEVGLGGRLDATNCVDSDLAVITTIDWDHQEYLGHSLNDIAYEKAGIMRFQKPCIYADFNPEPAIVAEAKRHDLPLLCLGVDYQYAVLEDKLVLDFKGQKIALPKTRLHNKAVIAAVVAAFCLKPKLPLSINDVLSGIQAAHIPGRVESWLDDGVHTVVDVAHNPQAAAYLASYIRQNFTFKKLHIVFSALADKDIAGMIKPLYPLAHFWYAASLEGKRALPAAKLLQYLQDHEIAVDLCYNSPVLAYEQACACASPGDLIVVYGSFLTAAKVLERRRYEINTR